jgi:prepilin peptidase CpaA
VIEYVYIGFSVCSAGLLLAAALHDIATRTIPNWIPASLAATGLVLRVHDGRALLSMGVALVVLVLFVVLWLRGLIGGGDAKLIPAASLALPPSGVPGFVLSVSIVGGILALVYLALSYVMRRPRPGPRHGFLARVIKAEAWRMHRRGPLPYGVAIAIGAFPAIARSFFE